MVFYYANVLRLCSNILPLFVPFVTHCAFAGSLIRNILTSYLLLFMPFPPNASLLNCFIG